MRAPRSLRRLLRLRAAASSCDAASRATRSRVVDGHAITKDEFDELIAQAKDGLQAAEARRSRRPARAEYQDAEEPGRRSSSSSGPSSSKEAKELGVDGRPTRRSTTRLDEDQEAVLRRQTRRSTQAQLKKQGITRGRLRDDIRAQLDLRRSSSTKVTKDVEGHRRGDQGVLRREQGPVRGSREPRRPPHPRRRQKALADEHLRAARERRATSPQLAKKYSTDPARRTGRQAHDHEGPDRRPQFDKARVRARDRARSRKPVKTQFGWHIIQALADVKPAKTTPFEDVKDADQAAAARGRRRTRR